MQLSRRARRICRKLQASGERDRIKETIQQDTLCSRAAAERHYLDHYRVADTRGVLQPDIQDPRSIDLSGGFWLEPIRPPEPTEQQVKACRYAGIVAIGFLVWALLEIIARMIY